MRSSGIAYSSIAYIALIFMLAAPFARGAAEETESPPLLGKTLISNEPWVPPNDLEPKVVYGDDDRLDIYEVTDPLQLKVSRSVCALLNASRLTPIAGGFELDTSAYRIGGTSACDGEPFGTQPTAAFCTGFLVGDDLIVTAGHCFSGSRLASARFVFGFTMIDPNTPVTTFSEDQVYQGVEIVARKLESARGEDYAVVRLDRPVTAPGVDPLEIRRTGAVGVGTPVGVIGHPSGLPLKVAFGSATLVRENSASDAFFEANLDTYGGNSGSPIFNAATGVVEGILVRGLQDFVFSGCFTSNVVPNTSADAEENNKMDELASFVPPLTGGEGEGEGEGENPAKIFTSPAIIIFRDVPILSTATHTIQVTNTGGEPLTGTATTSAPFSVESAANYSIAGGQSVAIQIGFSPQELGNTAGTLELSGGGGFSVTLAGTAIAIGEGEGEGEGEPQFDLCDDFAQINDEYRRFINDFGATPGFFLDGITEELALELVQLSACGTSVGSLLSPAARTFAPTRTAFDINLAALRVESSANTLAHYENVLAALFLISQNLQNSTRALIESRGYSLTQSYEVVTCFSWLCLPGEINKGAIAESDTDAYEVFETEMKSLLEPFSGAGDYDLDGTNNKTEVEQVRARGGDQEEELRAVADTTLDGTTPAPPIGCAGGPDKSEALWFGDAIAIAIASLSLSALGRGRRRTQGRLDF